jgi:cytochrome c5
MRKNGLPAGSVIFIVIMFAVFTRMAWTADQLPLGARTSLDVTGQKRMEDGRLMKDRIIEPNQMQNMMHRMMPDLLPPGIKPEDLPDPDSSGAKLLARFCNQCHNLPNPSMHSAQEWPQIVERMFFRMQMMSGMMGVESPTSEERQVMIAYLEMYALKSISPGSLPSAKSPGAVFFKNFCGQCHSLPDPESHSAVEWPALVEKMKKNMELMHKKVITEAEENQIVSFLQKNAKKKYTRNYSGLALIPAIAKLETRSYLPEHLRSVLASGYPDEGFKAAEESGR